MRTVKTALVLGAGISGCGAARLLAAEGAQVTLADQRSAAALDWNPADWRDQPVEVRFGQELWPAGDYDVVVVSPGIPEDAEWVRTAREQVPEVVSELEWGARRIKGRIMAVTGSNGKSTAVKWLAEALNGNGTRAVIAGNYGRSVCEAVLQEPAADWWVLEVSSFQLETVQTLRPDAACLTNLFPNHLDRHSSFEAYAALKARLFARMSAGMAAWVPPEWLATMQAGGGTPDWHTFGETTDCRCRYADSCVYIEDRCVADLQACGPALRTPVAAAVVGMGDWAIHDAAAAVEAARHFEPLPHRLEPVGTIDGVTYINDSKATNLAALRFALERIDRPVRLIAGGRAKEGGFKKLKEVLEDRVKCVYCIGNVAKQMYSAWSPTVACRHSGTLPVALEEATADACSGEVILLSPGCASFDQFRNYVERGERFAQWVRERTGNSRSSKVNNPGGDS